MLNQYNENVKKKARPSFFFASKYYTKQKNKILYNKLQLFA